MLNLKYFHGKTGPLQTELNFLVIGLLSPIISQRLLDQLGSTDQRMKNSLGCDNDSSKLSSEGCALQQLGLWLTSRSQTHLCCCYCSCVLTTLTDQEGCSEVRDLGCHYMAAPHNTCSGTEGTSQWQDTVHNGISGPCSPYYRRQRCAKYQFMLLSSFSSVPLSHQFLKSTANHLPCTLQGLCAFSCVKTEANQAAATTPSCLAALLGGLSFPTPPKQPQDPTSLR